MIQRARIMLDLPPRPAGSCRVTPRDAIAIAAAAGIHLEQPDRWHAWLSDEQGRLVFWWVAGDHLHLSIFG